MISRVKSDNSAKKFQWSLKFSRLLKAPFRKDIFFFFDQKQRRISFRKDMNINIQKVASDCFFNLKATIEHEKANFFNS